MALFDPKVELAENVPDEVLFDSLRYPWVEQSYKQIVRDELMIRLMKKLDEIHERQ
jgi:hypothetical protein